MDKQKIAGILQQRGVNRPCPRCGGAGFTVLDGYFNLPVQEDLNTTVIGGPSVPSVGIACDRCGNITLHALGALGLLPKQ